jgi:hypothetical protein
MIPPEMGQPRAAGFTPADSKDALPMTAHERFSPAKWLLGLFAVLIAGFVSRTETRIYTVDRDIGTLKSRVSAGEHDQQANVEWRDYIRDRVDAIYELVRSKE